MLHHLFLSCQPTWPLPLSIIDRFPLNVRWATTFACFGYFWATSTGGHCHATDRQPSGSEFNAVAEAFAIRCKIRRLAGDFAITTARQTVTLRDDHNKIAHRDKNSLIGCSQIIFFLASVDFFLKCFEF